MDKEKLFRKIIKIIRRNLDEQEDDSFDYKFDDFPDDNFDFYKYEQKDREAVENEVLELIKQNEEVMTCQNEHGCNIGMYAVNYGLTKVVLKALDNEEAVLQQDEEGQNIGMWCFCRSDFSGVDWGEEIEIFEKAIQNEKALVQQDKDGNNLGHLFFNNEYGDSFAEWEYVKSIHDYSELGRNIVLKLLKNKKASTQINKDGESVPGLLSKQIFTDLDLYREDFENELYNKLHDIAYKLLDYLDNEDIYVGHIGRFFAACVHDEKSVLKILDNEKLACQRFEYGGNIGMYAAENGMEEATLKALDNKEASCQQNDEGYNIGMIAAENGMEEATLKALDNKEASCQQNYYGYNIGMYAAENGFKKATSKALDNEEASCQQNKEGYNIGMIAANQGWDNVTLKALRNKKAAVQQNYIDNKNIGMIAARKRLPKATLFALFNDEAKKQKDYNLLDIWHTAIDSGVVYEMKEVAMDLKKKKKNKEVTK